MADQPWLEPLPRDPETGVADDRVPATPTTGDPGEPMLEPSAERAEGVTSPVEPSAPAASGPFDDRTTRRLLGCIVLPLAVLLLVGLAFTAGVGVGHGLLAPSTPSASSGDAELHLIDEAWTLLHTKYVGADSLDSRKLAYAAISAMTDAIGDTGHTTFLTPDDLAASQAALSGSYAGVGAEMDTAGDEPVVVGVFRDTPADRAGLRPGDVVVEVDGSPTKGVSLDAVVAKVRGPAGTPVTLTVRRTGLTELLTLRIVRANVEIPTVEYATVPGTQIGMIRVEQFSSNAGDAFKKALSTLLAGKPSGLILDLRGNPGGYVSDAVSVASQFLTSGDVYIERDASKKETPTAVAPGGIAPKIPLVVLVDAGTASAAEIVTGALQDAGRATIVGVRTFGTGTVLATYDLPDGSALRIGTVEWLTPDGHQIWHHGIVPNVIVGLPSGIRPVVPDDLRSMTQAQVAKSTDVQLRKAIEVLLGHPL